MAKDLIVPRPRQNPFAGFFKTFGMGKEKDTFLDNLSLMLGSDLPVGQALAAMKESVQSKRLRTIVEQLENDIVAGQHFWQAFSKTGLLPDYAISLIRIGEESGRLSENLKLLQRQRGKDRLLKERIHGSMIYPGLVLVLTAVLGTGIAWFILPRLANVFIGMRLQIPLLTRWLISLGQFLAHWGSIAIPAAFTLLFLLFCLLFVFPQTKFLGQRLLFAIPGIRTIIQEIELSRFGYVLGNLLAAGVPVVEAMKLVSQAAEWGLYHNLFSNLKNKLEEGNTFQKSFQNIPGINGLFPIPVQQIIMAGEQTGKLEQTFLSIGKTFEEKSELTAQNLTAVIEPLMLIIVWAGVTLVALAVIMPLYSLVGGLQNPSQNPTPPPLPIKQRPLKTSTTTQREFPLPTATPSAVR